jgi:hypothetical protein
MAQTMSDTDVDTVKGFDQIPEIAMPEDFWQDMPSYLARIATEYGPVFKRETPPGLQPPARLHPRSGGRS